MLHRREKLTIFDVAKAVGVSTGTVSRAFSEAPGQRINPATKARVLAVSEELGYHPSVATIRMRSKKTRVIGVPVQSSNLFDIDKSMSTQSSMDRIAGALPVLHQAGYQALPLFFESSRHLEKEILTLYRARHFDGLIMSGLSPVRPAIIRKLAAEGCCIATAYPDAKHPRIQPVLSDGSALHRAAVKHLADGGAKRILLNITGDVDRGVINDVKAEILFAQDFPWVPPTCAKEWAAFAAKVLEAIPDLDAILCDEELGAWAFSEAVSALGRRVPQDIKVAACCDARFRFKPLPVSIITGPVSVLVSQVLAREVLQLLANPSGKAPRKPILLPTPVVGIVECPPEMYARAAQAERDLEAIFQSYFPHQPSHIIPLG